MSFLKKFIIVSLTTVSLLGCKNNEQPPYNVDITVKHNNTTFFESTILVKEGTSYSKVEGDCKVTVFLSKINDVDVQLESELECDKDGLLFTPLFSLKEGSSAALTIGEKADFYSYAVRVTKN
ncbi:MULTISPECIES: hypothetical protein [Vibrionaceae]|uniref:hypothetical protein n=1 Tax=Vibrionaceae TaxID=641 RepID=UPI00148CE41B|nr:MULTISPECIES: hypothetical protein [Vibrionaceae]NOH90379.1 hypothetical protein [Vibrio alginolyticus]QSV17569.1 hypothetical protein FH974_26050 [Photobacterium ganghwense]